jgi:hypothetical protein
MKFTTHCYAVLTGDLVGSKQLSSDQLETLFKALNDHWKQFSEAHRNAVVGRVEIFRGDGWQAALKQASLAGKAALFLRAAIKAHPLSQHLDTRMGLGIGPVENLTPDRLGESNGLAFQRSGEALDDLAKGSCNWGLRTGIANLITLETVGFPMMDLAVSRWTRAEAMAIMGSLLGWTQEKIAEHPYSAKKDGKAPTQQAVADTLRRVAWKSHWIPVLEAVKTSIDKEI